MGAGGRGDGAQGALGDSRKLFFLVLLVFGREAGALDALEWMVVAGGEVRLYIDLFCLSWNFL